MIIGITGGTGSGKSTLLECIRQHGGLVLDCDAIYHRLLTQDADLLSAIEDRFPGTVVRGQLDRKKLGELVFSHEKALLDLNAITHSAVKKEVLRLLADTPPLAAIDAIGLFEGGLAELCDVTVAITAPKELRVARLMARDGISEAYARKRIAAQKPDSWYTAQCHFTLDNSGTQAQFREKCLAFLLQMGIMDAER